MIELNIGKSSFSIASWSSCCKNTGSTSRRRRPGEARILKERRGAPFHCLSTAIGYRASRASESFFTGTTPSPQWGVWGIGVGNDGAAETVLGRLLQPKLLAGGHGPYPAGEPPSPNTTRSLAGPDPLKLDTMASSSARSALVSPP